MIPKGWNCVSAVIIVMAANPAQADDVKEEIAARAKVYDAAVRDRDAEALGRLFDEDFRAVEWDGKAYDKPGKIAFVTREAVTHETSTSQIESVRAFGDTAIESGVWTSTGIEDGRPKTWRLRYTAVWVKKGGTWLLTAEQSTSINEGGAAGAVKTGANQAGLLDALMNLERRSWDLAKAQDVVGLKELFPDDAVQIYVDGTRYDKAAYLATFPAIRLDAYAIEGKVDLMMLAPEAATLTFRVSYTVTEEGKEARKVSALATSTYVRRGERWWGVLYQETPVK